MNSNLRIISGVLSLSQRNGGATINFRDGSVSGNAAVDDEGIRGTGVQFRGTPHVIISPSDLSLSTQNNTSYSITRTPSSDSLRLDWRINSAGGALEIDFLVIGEVA